MSKHFKKSNTDLRKTGLTVTIRPYVGNVTDENTAKSREAYEIKALDQAMKKLKTLMRDEGLINELKKREFYVSKGQKARKKRKEGIMRQKTRDRNNLKNNGF